MKWILTLLMLTALPALAQLPPSPLGSTKLLSPKHAEHVASLGTAMVKAAVAAAPKMGWLVWDYPPDQLTNVFFDVYHAMTLTNTPPLSRWDQMPNNFSLMSTVDSATTLSITFSQMQEFFIVRARDKISGVVSNWNVP